MLVKKIRSENLKSFQVLSPDFFLYKSLLFSSDYELMMKVKKKGYVPKSGLLLAQAIKRFSVYGKALDIGTGDLGFLANNLAYYGANDVFAVDLDKHAVEWAKGCSNFSHKIRWHNCDLFPHDEWDFNFIVSNPPQMPMPVSGSLHDYGGINGRETIIRIIKGSRCRLVKGGTLFLLCFDFLGVDYADEKMQSIFEIAGDNRFKTDIVSKNPRVIRKGGKTEENIKWIRSIYPWYSFFVNENGDYCYNLLVLKLVLT